MWAPPCGIKRKACPVSSVAGRCKNPRRSLTRPFKNSFICDPWCQNSLRMILPFQLPQTTILIIELIKGYSTVTHRTSFLKNLPTWYFFWIDQTNLSFTVAPWVMESDVFCFFFFLYFFFCCCSRLLECDHKYEVVFSSLFAMLISFHTSTQHVLVVLRSFWCVFVLHKYDRKGWLPRFKKATNRLNNYSVHSFRNYDKIYSSGTVFKCHWFRIGLVLFVAHIWNWIFLQWNLKWDFIKQKSKNLVGHSVKWYLAQNIKSVLKLKVRKLCSLNLLLCLSFFPTIFYNS